ncbi:DUF3325 family protein [Psychrobacter aquaticus]|uniref:DUF3325 domain-containing protein n=1 Tax=Psychrobacter aquaticus CMS 56 TaxID=1354303 RepID=U4T167_9GAMM|nr:DUF3325 family protein [Psychrobacter aquaticus]ERL54362.1 hypothetical protein M917_2510 [Psychrobacter aquaticus CMS 56]
MSGVMLSGLLLLLNLLSMIVLMMSSNRHSEKFQHKLPPFLNRQGLRWLGLILLAIAFVLTYGSHQTGYFVVIWFASVTLAAGLIYLAMMIYEQL